MRLTIRHVTLRSVGWRRAGILEPIYAKIAAEGFSDARDELARRTKIPGTNLSAINQGNRDMTNGYAARIASAAGISPAELGSDAGGGASQALLMLDRLAALQAAFEQDREDRDRAHAALVSRLGVLEEALRKATPLSFPEASGGDPTS